MVLGTATEVSLPELSVGGRHGASALMFRLWFIWFLASSEQAAPSAVLIGPFRPISGSGVPTVSYLYSRLTGLPW